MKITALAGGVGAAKFLEGLVRIVPQENISIIVNTGDDEEFYGLYVCPDLDIITYTLAGIVDKNKGWGIKGDTFNCLEMLSKYGYETWFKLGDKDLATHIHRTLLLKQGRRLTEVAEDIAKKLGVKAKVIPMTDNRVRTMIVTDRGVLKFQEYFVREKTKVKVKKVYYEGVEKATPSPEALQALREADLVIVCPSNPILSIGPIISLREIREELRRKKVTAISPIVGGKALKGPTDRLMRDLGIEPSAYSIAVLYKDFLDLLIIDEVDKHLKKEIEKVGIKVEVTNTVMKTIEDKINLARFTIKKSIELLLSPK
ncbi:MAG: 2-phospho-L-lactate transferase [Thermoprotei archaeon]|nr:MAG: 2-phospho-L-lactate transferase [Thermoprotei archaeon]